MSDLYAEEVVQVYETLKERYDLRLTNTFALDEGFTTDMLILTAKANGLILELFDDGMLVLDILDEEKTKGTHWHPLDAERAVADVVDFMENKPQYNLQPFPKSKS